MQPLNTDHVGNDWRKARWRSLVVWIATRQLLATKQSRSELLPWATFKMVQQPKEWGDLASGCLHDDFFYSPPYGVHGHPAVQGPRIQRQKGVQRNRCPTRVSFQQTEVGRTLIKIRMRGRCNHRRAIDLCYPGEIAICLRGVEVWFLHSQCQYQRSPGHLLTRTLELEVY